MAFIKYFQDPYFMEFLDHYDILELMSKIFNNTKICSNKLVILINKKSLSKHLILDGYYLS